MHPHLYFVTTCLIWILMTVSTGVAIDCWVCSSTDPGCGEIIDEQTLQNNRKTESGCSGCGKSFLSLGTSFYSIDRTCLSTASDTCINKLGYGDCTCSTTYCNGQTRVLPSHAYITTICAAAVLLWRWIV